MLPVKVLLFEKADPSLVSVKIELIGHLGVLISLLARRRRKYIFLFLDRKSNFGELYVCFKLQVNSRSTNLARLLLDSFCTEPCLRILIPLFVLKLDLFSAHKSANLFVFSDFIC